jgi:hypothetical protein
MSSDMPQDSVAGPPGLLRDGKSTPHRLDGSNSSQDLEVHFHSGDFIRNHEDEGAQTARSRDELRSPTTPGPLKKEKEDQDDSPAIEESMEARLERLGRQRPETFHSAWSEIGFVFSVCMCQVLSVSHSS